MLEIAPAELKARLERGEALQLLDIREGSDYAEWHIEGSANLPVYEALRAGDDGALLSRSNALDRDRPIVTVCQGGVVSLRAATLLRSQGYEALSLEGGMHGWGAVWSTARIPAPAGRTLLQFRRNGKGCLSYLVGGGGEAVAVDPSADVAAYLEAAAEHGLRITHVLETHVHADHLSRARELCRATGAKLVLPANRRVSYPFTPIEDRAKLAVGGVVFEAIATPGHTGESTTYLVDGATLLTGDTLFVDSVGRPDLERGDPGAASGAQSLYRSLHTRLLQRFAELPFYPAHHGRPIGLDGVAVGSSLGRARAAIPLLHADEPAFIETVVASLGAKPSNFATIIAINEGKRELAELDPLDLEAGPNRCAARVARSS